MKNGRRQRQVRRYIETSSRLERHLQLAADMSRPRRDRTRSARYAAALAEQLGILERPAACAWCRRRQRAPLQRHHWDYDRPLEVTFLCPDCHRVADPMVWQAAGA